MPRPQSQFSRFLEYFTHLSHGISRLRIPATNFHNSGAGRFTISLFISVAIHLMPFMIGLLHFSSAETGQQIILQATLQPLPNKPIMDKPVAKPEQASQRKPENESGAAKADNKPSMEEMVTANSIIKIPQEENITQQQAASEPSSEPLKEQSEPEKREAFLIAAPGAPTYPQEAIQRKLESCVLAAVYVSPGGEVEKVAILHADVTGVFDQSVIETQTIAHYLPARVGNSPVASRVLAVVSFVLEPAHHLSCAMQYAVVAQKISLLTVAEIIPLSLFEGLPHVQ